MHMLQHMLETLQRGNIHTQGFSWRSDQCVTNATCSCVSETKKKCSNLKLLQRAIGVFKYYHTVILKLNYLRTEQWGYLLYPFFVVI